MKIALLAVLLCLPFTTTAMKEDYGQFPIEIYSFVHQSFYMMSPKDVKKFGGPEPGKSYIDASFSIVPAEKSANPVTYVEAGIIPDEIYKQIGFERDGQRMYCCDAQAVADKKCREPNRIAFQPGVDVSSLGLQTIDYKGGDGKIEIHKDIEQTGKYVMILGLCDERTSGIILSGKSTVINPHGHLLGNVFGVVKFTGFMFAIYTCIFFVWILRCCLYKRELMSVHYTITIVIALFVFDMLIKYIDLKQTNENGYKDTFITFFSAFVSSGTRAVSRILTLMIASGLGVSKASLGRGIVKILVVGGFYFLFSLWDSILNQFYDSKTPYTRIIISSILDTYIYYLILQSLIDTIQDLADKKQNSKLSIFSNLLKIIFVSVIVSTIYNVFFSLTIEVLEKYWQYQWFFSDGVWSVFYCALVVSIMFLWSPNENSGSLAMRIELATEERQDAEEYTMESLQSVEGNQSVEVTTVKEDLKPMQIKSSN